MLSYLIYLAAASVSAASPATSASQVITLSSCDVGEHYQFEIATCSIEARNNSDKPVRITKAEAFRAADRIQPTSTVVPAGSSSYFQAQVNLGNREGVAYHPFRFTIEGKEPAQRNSGVNAYVQSVLDQSHPKFDFGTVRMTSTEQATTKSVTLSSREVSDLKIVGIEEAPGWLDVQIDPDGKTIRASLKKDAPWGLTHNGEAYVKVGLNAAQQRHAWIEVDVNVLGEVAPDSDPFQFGLMRTTEKRDYLLRLTSRTKEDFKLGRLTLKDIKGKATAKPCVPAASGCRLISIAVDNKQPIGKLVGVLEVELPDLKKTLPIELFGILLPPETKIHDMDELPKSTGGQSQSGVEVGDKVNLNQAFADAVKQEDAPPPGNGPLLRWSVAHQTSVYGYVIYRSDSESGPLMRVSKSIIPASTEDSDAPTSYQWRDNVTESGKAYWYLIGVLNRDGTKKDLTGRQKVIAK